MDILSEIVLFKKYPDFNIRIVYFGRKILHACAWLIFYYYFFVRILFLLNSDLLVLASNVMNIYSRKLTKSVCLQVTGSVFGNWSDPMTWFRSGDTEGKGRIFNYFIAFNSVSFTGYRNQRCYPSEHENSQFITFLETGLIGSSFGPGQLCSGQTLFQLWFSVLKLVRALEYHPGFAFAPVNLLILSTVY